MKVAISLPDELSILIDRAMRKLGLSRSALLSAAAAEYLARHATDDDATASWNNAIAAGGKPGSDPGARAFQKRSKAVVRRARGAWK